jgi:TrbM
MRRLFTASVAATIALAGLMMHINARADDDVSACGSVLCLAGLIAGGSADGACHEYVRRYFSITRFHNGHFDLSGTSSARAEFTEQCSSVASSTRDSVNDKYGAQQYAP